jgi:hypothetical protein
MPAKTAKSDDKPGDAASAPAPPQGQTVPVRVTDRGDGWPYSGGMLRGGETVEVGLADARDLVARGMAEWTTKIRATGVEVVTSRAVLAKGQVAAVDPAEAERLTRLGLAEVVKED